jgi:multidrug resistance protein, MATE family
MTEHAKPLPRRRLLAARHPHHRHRSRHQLVARAFALARRHHGLRRGARAGRGLRADGLLPRELCDEATMPRAPREAWLAWYAARPTRPASRSAPPARATRVQGLRPQLRRGAALARPTARPRSAGLAPHHAGRHGLALQPLCRAGAAATGADHPPPDSFGRPAPALGPTRLSGTRPPGAARQRCAASLPLAWPVLIGQLSVLAFGTVDTLLVARALATDLAALAVGSAAYITVFIGLMGVVMAIARSSASSSAPASCTRPATRCTRRCGWPGAGGAGLRCCWSFRRPSWRWRRPRPRSPPRCAATCWRWPSGAAGLAAVHGAYRGFNTAVSRPKAVMVLQLGGLALKVPLSALVHGVPALGLPALGVVGCGIATAVAMWAQALLAPGGAAARPFYAPLRARRPRPGPARSRARCGRSCGWACRWALAMLIEVTGFSFMAIFIARLGTTPVAGHQIAANLVSLLFMVPLALSNATSTLVAQRIGARDLADARRLGWHGLQIGCGGARCWAAPWCSWRARRWWACTPRRRRGGRGAAAAGLAGAVPRRRRGADLAAFVLRAWRIATVPMVIYAVRCGAWAWAAATCWPSTSRRHAAALRGAPGFWMAATAGLVLAALALTGSWPGWCAPPPRRSAGLGSVSTKQLPPPFARLAAHACRRGARRSAAPAPGPGRRRLRARHGRAGGRRARRCARGRPRARPGRGRTPAARPAAVGRTTCTSTSSPP